MEWWKTLAPLVGVALGILGTLLGQKLSDRRTLQRDRLLAAEEARCRLNTERVTIQRESIMEIQNALEGIMAANRIRPGQRLSEAFRTTATASSLHLNAHIARLEDRELAASVRTWLGEHENVEAAQAALNKLQERLSERLRALYGEVGTSEISSNP